jgi:hypothetical protein
MNNIYAKEKVIRAVKGYLDPKPRKVDVIRDPNFAFTFAIRATREDIMGPIYFLIENVDTLINENKNLEDYLEEVEFDTWPPKTKY